MSCVSFHFLYFLLPVLPSQNKKTCTRFNPYHLTSYLLIPYSTFKKRAGRAVREIKKFATAMMSTKTVKIDAELNRYVWHKGIRNVPVRVRVKLSRSRNEDEDAKEKSQTVVSYVPLPSRSNFRNLSTKVDGEEEK